MSRFAAAALVALLLAPCAQGAVRLGVYGDASHFRDVTGQRSYTKHYFPPWGMGDGNLGRALANHGPVPMLAITTKLPGGVGEAIKPLGIARGKGDAFLVDLNAALHAFGGRAYIRPMPEMNGHWAMYCAYNANGTKRGAAYSQRAFRNAFRRIYVMVKGGTRAEMNAKLSRYDVAPIGVNLPENPRVRVIWNPQGFGSPNVLGNMPAAYWPGGRFVDVVGNDLYYMNGKAMWAAAHDLYRQYPKKPYAFPEWGLWGQDAPSFIRRMRDWVASHPRVELIAWYNGGAGSVFDLGTKPLARRAYRQLIVPLGG